MKRGLGVFALLAVLAAGARWAIAPPSSGSESKAAARTVVYPHGSQKSETSTCSEFADQQGAADAGPRGELITLIDEFLRSNGRTPAGDAISLPAGIRVVVATVPDPLHTHLNLQFDRVMEAIQQAAQDEGYTYDRSWLPWKAHAAEFGSRTDQGNEEKDTLSRERCPGLILFRKSFRHTSINDHDSSYTRGLFVFLVGEKPTTGVDRTQWDITVDWIAAHRDRASDGALRILGPTFSGSIASTVRALADLQARQTNFTSILLYTGTVRGCFAYNWLTDELQSPAMRVPVRIADFNQNDAVQIDRYFRYLKDRNHSLSEVAILSEDETAYGGLPDSRSDQSTDAAADPRRDQQISPCEPKYQPPDWPLHLYYPRDISALRSAYQEQSIFASSTESTSASHVVLQPQADASTHTDTDTIVSFGGANLALAQEAQMYGVIDSLRTHAIRYVILRSTSSLDYLFLTRFLHRAYPDAFIVTMGEDMLFGREIDSTEFRGVQALSAFPLLPRGQDWTATSNTVRHAHRIFGSDAMEGGYLATRFLISDPPATRGEPTPYIHTGKPNLPDYDAPFWANRQAGQIEPSTWLSVIGRNGYWPLAILTDPYGGVALESNLAPVSRPGPDKTALDKSNPLRPVLVFSSTWKLCCVFAVLAIILQYFACRHGWSHQELSMFIQFTPLSGKRQLFLVAIGWTAINSLLLMLLLCSARLANYLDGKDSVWIWILGVAAVMGCIFMAVDLGLRAYEEPRHAKERMLRTVLWIVLPLMLLALSFWCAWKIFDLNDANGVATAYRAIHLTSGVSPIVSLLLMLGGFYWWFWHTLSGLALLGAGRPLLPDARNLPHVLARISSSMANDIENFAIPFPEFKGGRMGFYLLPAAILALELCAIRHFQNFDSILHSLENTAFNATLHALFAFALYILIFETSQFFGTWLSLKRFLLALNRTPLRRTFAALQGLSMQSLWSMSGTSSRARYTIFSHQLEALFHLRNVLFSFGSRDCGDDEIRADVETACQQGMTFVEDRCASADLAMINDAGGRRAREVFQKCTEQLFKKLILPEWIAATRSLDLIESGQKVGPLDVLPLSDNMVVRRAEEFVSLIYVGYLQNLLARMRTIVLSIVGVFAALAFSLAFYPYTPRPSIAIFLLSLLLILGTIVAMVYAGLDRDTTLSRITNTEPGTLGMAFWVRLASFVGVPLMGLLTAQFPGVTDFVISWIQPTLNAVK